MAGRTGRSGSVIDTSGTYGGGLVSPAMGRRRSFVGGGNAAARRGSQLDSAALRQKLEAQAQLARQRQQYQVSAVADMEQINDRVAAALAEYELFCKEAARFYGARDDNAIEQNLEQCKTMISKLEATEDSQHAVLENALEALHRVAPKLRAIDMEDDEVLAEVEPDEDAGADAASDDVSEPRTRPVSAAFAPPALQSAPMTPAPLTSPRASPSPLVTPALQFTSLDPRFGLVTTPEGVSQWTEHHQSLGERSTSRLMHLFKLAYSSAQTAQEKLATFEKIESEKRRILQQQTEMQSRQIQQYAEQLQLLTQKLEVANDKARKKAASNEDMDKAKVQIDSLKAELKQREAGLKLLASAAQNMVPTDLFQQKVAENERLLAEVRARETAVEQAKAECSALAEQLQKAQGLYAKAKDDAEAASADARSARIQQLQCSLEHSFNPASGGQEAGKDDATIGLPLSRTHTMGSQSFRMDGEDPEVGFQLSPDSSESRLSRTDSTRTDQRGGSSRTITGPRRSMVINGASQNSGKPGAGLSRSFNLGRTPSRASPTPTGMSSPGFARSDGVSPSKLETIQHQQALERDVQVLQDRLTAAQVEQQKAAAELQKINAERENQLQTIRNDYAAKFTEAALDAQKQWEAVKDNVLSARKEAANALVSKNMTELERVQAATAAAEDDKQHWQLELEMITLQIKAASKARRDPREVHALLKKAMDAELHIKAADMLVAHNSEMERILKRDEQALWEIEAQNLRRQVQVLTMALEATKGNDPEALDRIAGFVAAVQRPPATPQVGTQLSVSTQPVAPYTFKSGSRNPTPAHASAAAAMAANAISNAATPETSSSPTITPTPPATRGSSAGRSRSTTATPTAGPAQPRHAGAPAAAASGTPHQGSSASATGTVPHQGNSASVGAAPARTPHQAAAAAAAHTGTPSGAPPKYPIQPPVDTMHVVQPTRAIAISAVPAVASKSASSAAIPAITIPAAMTAPGTVVSGRVPSALPSAATTPSATPRPGGPPRVVTPAALMTSQTASDVPRQHMQVASTTTLQPTQMPKTGTMSRSTTPPKDIMRTPTTILGRAPFAALSVPDLNQPAAGSSVMMSIISVHPPSPDATPPKPATFTGVAPVLQASSAPAIPAGGTPIVSLLMTGTSMTNIKADEANKPTSTVKATPSIADSGPVSGWNADSVSASSIATALSPTAKAAAKARSPSPTMLKDTPPALFSPMALTNVEAMTVTPLLVSKQRDPQPEQERDTATPPSPPPEPEHLTLPELQAEPTGRVVSIPSKKVESPRFVLAGTATVTFDQLDRHLQSRFPTSYMARPASKPDHLPRDVATPAAKSQHVIKSPVRDTVGPVQESTAGFVYKAGFAARPASFQLRLGRTMHEWLTGTPSPSRTARVPQDKSVQPMVLSPRRPASPKRRPSFRSPPLAPIEQTQPVIEYIDPRIKIEPAGVTPVPMPRWAPESISRHARSAFKSTHAVDV